MSELLFNQADRCLICVHPTCRSGCPLGNDIPAVIKLIRSGDYAQAVQTIGHPFGEICGYVCPSENLCQGGCVLSKRGYPVLTGVVERELFVEHPYVVERKGNALKGKNYAVVGGGVAGLTFAVKVYEQGADVTVYERLDLLSTIKLIPNLRLPYDAILRVEQALSNRFTIVREQIDGERLKTLKTQFDGVYVSTGLTLDYGLGVEGEKLSTPYRDCLNGNYRHGTVIVVGGGNSAMDCARLVKSQGSRSVVAYRRTESDMPAFAKEIAQAKDEEVEFWFNAAPVKLVEAGGKLNLTLAKTVSEGRGKLTVTDDTFDLECDSVIAAIGSKFDGTILSCDKNADSYLQYDNVYLGGDAKRGKLVVDAVCDGLRAAEQIIKNRG